MGYGRWCEVGTWRGGLLCLGGWLVVMVISGSGGDGHQGWHIGLQVSDSEEGSGVTTRDS